MFNFTSGQRVLHYYGDTLRSMFLAAAIVYAVAMPLVGELLPIGTFGGIGVVLFLVLLAGFTNPRLKSIMLVNVVVAAVGVGLLQFAAIQYLHTESGFLFVLRELSVVLFLVAFYEGVKTLRNMLLGKIGVPATRGEFDRKP